MGSEASGAIIATEVRVHDIRLAARIGAFPHEEGRRQTLRIQVVLKLCAAPSDILAQTVDYGLVVALAEALADEHIALIETFASRLAIQCLEADGVARAEVLVEKPGALANGIASAHVVAARP